MITFKQFLAEAFDNPLPYKLTKRERVDSKSPDDSFTYQFKLDNVSYDIDIVSRLKEDRPTRIIVFSAENPRSYSTPFAPTKRNKDQFRILATVKDIIFKHTDRFPMTPGHVIEFDSFDPSATKLYTKFAQELAKRTGSTLRVHPTHDGKADFILEKK